MREGLCFLFKGRFTEEEEQLWRIGRWNTQWWTDQWNDCEKWGFLLNFYWKIEFILKNWILSEKLNFEWKLNFMWKIEFWVKNRILSEKMNFD